DSNSRLPTISLVLEARAIRMSRPRAPSSTGVPSLVSSRSPGASRKGPNDRKSLLGATVGAMASFRVPATAVREAGKPGSREKGRPWGLGPHFARGREGTETARGTPPATTQRAVRRQVPSGGVLI